MSKSNKIIALGLIAAGVAVYIKSRPAAPVDGMGRFGFKSITNAVSKAVAPITKVTDSKIMKPVLAVATGGASLMTKQAVKVVQNPTAALKKLDPVKALSKVPIINKSPLIRKLTGGRAQTTVAPEPGQAVIYQDANGNTITEAQYNMIMQVVGRLVPPVMSGPGGLYTDSAGQQFTQAEYAAWLQAGGAPAVGPYQPQVATDPVKDDPYRLNPYQTPGIMPPPNSPTYNPTSYASGGGGGGGGGTSYTDAASAFSSPAESPGSNASAPMQQFAPEPVEAAAEAPKKMSPLVVIGTLLAVPVFMGMTGGK